MLFTRSYDPQFGSDLLGFSVTPDQGSDFAGNATDLQNGQILLQFSPTVAQDYTLSLDWRVESLQDGVAQALTVAPDVLHTGTCVATGPGVASSIAGEAATFTIISKVRHL